MKKIAIHAVLLFALALSTPSQALPLSVQIDMLTTRLVEQLKGQDYTKAVQTIRELRATGARMPPSLDYFEGKALFESGEQAAAYEKFAHYTKTQGKGAKYYKQTIAYLVKAQAAWEKAQAKLKQQHEKAAQKAARQRRAAQGKAEQQKSATLTFEHLFGGGTDEAANAIVGTADGGLALAGYSGAAGTRKDDMWIIGLDTQAKVRWNAAIRSNADDAANALVQTADGGFVLAGSRKSPTNERDVHALVVRLDARGEVLWDHTIDDSMGEANAIAQTGDGGFALAGWSDAGLTGHAIPRVIRLDAQGKVRWERHFQGAQRGVANAISPTADGGFVVAGWTEYDHASPVRNQVAWVTRLDGAGKVLWEHSFDSSKYCRSNCRSLVNRGDVANAVVQTTDGGYAVAGVASSKGSGSYNAWILRLDAQGQVVWDRAFGPENEFRWATGNAIAQTADGGFVMAGVIVAHNGSSPNQDALVIRLDRQGKFVWGHTFGAGGDDWANGIVRTDGGGLAVAGGTDSAGAGGYDAWLMLLNQNGWIDR